MAEVTVTSSNDLEAYVLNTLKTAADYADTQGVKLYNGEFGVYWKEPPSTGANYSTADQILMNALADKYFTYANLRGMGVAGWAISHEGFNDYFFSPYSIDNSTGVLTVRPNAAPYESHYADGGTNGQATFSLNGAGNEFYVDTGNDPPQYGSGFASNGYSQATLNALAARGLRSTRYNVGQPGSNGQWLWKDGALNTTANSTFIKQIENTYNRHQNAGMKIMLDALHPGSGNEYARINGQTITGTSTTTGPGYSDYIAYLTALLNHTFLDANGVSTALKDHPAWEGLDPVNEPQYGVTGNIDNWRYTIQQIFNDVRDVNQVNYQGFMIAPAGHYSGLQDMPGNAPQITDPANNYAIGCHFYLDSLNCGCDKADVGGNTTHTWAEHLNARSGEAAFSDTVDTGGGGDPVTENIIGIGESAPLPGFLRTR